MLHLNSASSAWLKPTECMCVVAVTGATAARASFDSRVRLVLEYQTKVHSNSVMTIRFNLIQTYLCIWFDAYELINVWQITYIILMVCIHNWFYSSRCKFLIHVLNEINSFLRSPKLSYYNAMSERAAKFCCCYKIDVYYVIKNFYKKV